MKIEQLTLERYGSFSDRALCFRPDATLHLVVGPNESGKTSALSAIGDLIFGFEHSTSYDFAHSAKNLRVGGVFRLADGSSIAFRRRKGIKNTLIDANDQPLPDDLLTRLLGSVDRSTFEREFGLTTPELREGGKKLLAAGGRLAETLAASSAGLTVLSRLRDSLTSSTDALFTPRKSSTKTFYIVLDRHDEAERRLRDAIVTADAFQAANLAVEEAGKASASLRAEHEETGRDLARLQRAARTRPKLGRLGDLTNELGSFADLPLVAPQTIAEWRTALVADKALADQLEKIIAADAADDAAIAELAVDEALLAEGEVIDALRERLGAVRKAVEDLPRRVEAMNAAHNSLSEAARRLGLASHEALLAGLPPDAALARVRELIASGRRNSEKHRELVSRLETATRQRNLLAAEHGSVGDTADPEPFRLQLDTLTDIPTSADRLGREIVACDTEAHSLVEAAAALDPIATNPDALAMLPLPDAETIAFHLRIVEALAVEMRDVRARVTAADRAIKAAETATSRLSRDGAIATRADLAAARDDRERGFEDLQTSLEDPLGDRSSRLADVRSLTRQADDITDALLTDTERAGRRQAAEENLVEQREEKNRAENELVELESRRRNEEAAWRAIWTASAVDPRSPTEMTLWRNRVADILDRRQSLLQRRVEVDVLSRSVAAAKTPLLNLLGDHGARPDTTLPAELLYREARMRLDNLQKAWGEAKARQIAQTRAERDVIDAASDLSVAMGDIAEHTKAWPEAVARVGLTGSASLDEAEAALSVWQSALLPRQSFDREQRSVRGIERDLKSFDDAVAAVVTKASPGFASLRSQDALARLTAALADARRAEDARSRLREALSQHHADRMVLETRREIIRDNLRDAYETLGVEDASGFETALASLERRKTLEDERSAVARDLLDIADGLDEAALRAEQSGIDIDLAPGEIDRLGLRQSQLLAEMSEASTVQYQAERDRDTLVKGREAAHAARERSEAAAELLSIAERWIVGACAARLATRAIERHRAAAQDPLIERAGFLFSVATANAFSGLGADYDSEDRPVLVARRIGGDPVKIDGLSEGTRDQLFLALRLALLERRVREPLPFIGDDLLASFDEKRTERTLALLSEFSRNRQVILFTHHRHVAELAAALADPAADIIMM